LGSREGKPFLDLPKAIQYVKKLFETNKGNFSRSKPIIGRRITFNPEEIGAFGLEQFVYILYILRTKKDDWPIWGQEKVSHFHYPHCIFQSIIPINLIKNINFRKKNFKKFLRLKNQTRPMEPTHVYYRPSGNYLPFRPFNNTINCGP
jgi:hypothetical protein